MPSIGQGCTALAELLARERSTLPQALTAAQTARRLLELDCPNRTFFPKQQRQQEDDSGVIDPEAVIPISQKGISENGKESDSSPSPIQTLQCVDMSEDRMQEWKEMVDHRSKEGNACWSLASALHMELLVRNRLLSLTAAEESWSSLSSPSTSSATDMDALARQRDGAFLNAALHFAGVCPVLVKSGIRNQSGDGVRRVLSASSRDEEHLAMDRGPSSSVQWLAKSEKLPHRCASLGRVLDEWETSRREVENDSKFTLDDNTAELKAEAAEAYAR